MNHHGILIIEDNSLNLELTSDLLEASGFCVWSARSAEEGLQLARSIRPDLVLMDINLPCMDGLGATRALRADPATQDLVIVGLTAHAMIGDEEAALRAGCNAYLTKPINTRTFVATINEIMGRAPAPHGKIYAS